MKTIKNMYSNAITKMAVVGTLLLASVCAGAQEADKIRARALELQENAKEK